MLDGDYLRRGTAEFIGTFTLIFIGAGAASSARTFTDLALANGLAIGVMICAMGFTSGGLFNPAITLGFLITRRIAPALAVCYWVVQFAAAALAALLLKWVLPSSLESQFHLGVPAVGSGIGHGQAVVVEAVLTFFLVWVVFGTAVDPRSTFKVVAGLAIGLTISIDVLMGGALTGAAMNPARAFGPQLVGNHWEHWWIWYVGPFAGAVIAASVYEMLYLRPAADASADAATTADTATT